MTDRWFDKTVSQIETTLDTDKERGLSTVSVRARLKRGGKNTIYPEKQSSTGILSGILSNWLALLMLFTIIIAAIFEQSSGILIMAIILIANFFLNLAMYREAQKVLDGMGNYGKPNARVLREGKLLIVSQESVVPGDILLLEAGDIIPCDARLISSSELDVLETNITSVPKATRKNAEFIDYHDISPANQLNMVFATTIVTHGKGKAIACVTGKDTLVCKMKKNVSPVSKDRLAILDTMGSFCKKWTLFMSVAVLVLTAVNLIVSVAETGIFGIFLTSLSLAVASMSEFYSAFVYVILACGIFNAVRHYRLLYSGAIIKNSAKIEKLKDLSCIIVPKDAAFIVPDMHIEKIYADGVLSDVSERTFFRHSAVALRCALISTALYGGDKSLVQSDSENYISTEEKLIIDTCERFNLNGSEITKKYPVVEHIPKSETNRFDTTLYLGESGYRVACRGDYHKLLTACRYYVENGKIIEITREKRNELLVTAAMLTKNSYHVIAVASKDTIYNNLQKLIACQSDMIFEGFIAITRPLLDGVAKNTARCLSAGVKVIMFCDEVSEENRYLAETLGIIRSEDQILSGFAMSRMKEADFIENVMNYRVYEGLTASQRNAVIKCLSVKGEKIGFLGSWLTDIALMRQADVGFAQSVTMSPKAAFEGVDVSSDPTYYYRKEKGEGCESLKFISDVIISEPDKNGGGGFNAIVDSMLCSRVVFMNMSRMIRYMLSSQVARFVLVLISVLLGINSLSPTQILFCGLAVDFFAVIVIAFEKPSQDMLYLESVSIKELLTPFRSNIVPVILGLIWAVLGYFVPMFLKQYGIISTDSEATTLVFLSFILTQIAVLIESKKEKSIFVPNVRVNRFFIFALVLTGALFASMLFIPEIASMFGVVMLSPLGFCGVLIMPIVLLIVYEICKLLMPK